jgi:hypothetical protein
MEHWINDLKNLAIAEILRRKTVEELALEASFLEESAITPPKLRTGPGLPTANWARFFWLNQESHHKSLQDAYFKQGYL